MSDPITHLLGERRAAYIRSNLPSIAISTDQEMEEHGLTPHEIHTIRAALDLTTSIFGLQGDVLNTPARVAAYTFKLNSYPVEHLYRIEVDVGLRVTRVQTHEGTRTQVALSYDDLFADLKDDCFLVHNHPSGDCTPSRSDLRFTNNAKHYLLEKNLPRLHDHIVVGRGRWFSIVTREEGRLLPEEVRRK